MTQPAPNPPPAAPAEASPPEPTIPMVDRQGQVVPVPHDQALAAYKSGNLGFVKGSSIPVVGSDGTVGTVDAEHAPAVLAGGGSIASPDVLRQAQLNAKYGGAGGMAAATGEGVARGLTLGVSDPLAVLAGRVFGGDHGAESVRTHLAEEKEAHPYLAGAGELGGAALPILLSGGAAAPEESGVIAGIGKGVRTLGALPASVSYLGDAAEHAVSGLLGASDTALGGAARAAAKAATRGIVEGGLSGAGQEISESSLDNQPLTAEKLFASVGHGALMGGLLGGAVSGAGKLAGDAAAGLLGRASTTLDEAAGEQAWKWLDPLKKYSDQATKRAGGTDEVGRTVFEEVLRPLVEEKGLGAAALSNDEKYELVQKAIDAKGKAIGDLVAGNAHAQVPLEEMLRPINDRIEEFSGRVGGEDKVATLTKLRDSVQRVLGDPGADDLEANLSGLVPGSPEHEAVLADAGWTKRSPGELAEHLRANPELLDGRPIDHTATHAAPAVPETTGMVPIADAIKQRRALQQLAFEESKSLDPNLRVQLLRDVSGEWNRIEETALNKASSEAGGELAGTQLRALNKTYQQLKIASDALETNTARYATNRNLSLTDYLSGAAHAPGMLLAGHPAAAVGAVGLSVAHKALRAHGNAYAALMLDRLATFGGASKAVSEVNEEVDRAIDQALSSKAPRKIPRAFHTTAPDTESRFHEEESRVRQIAAMSPGLIGAHLQDRTGPLGTHMPATAASMQSMTRQANAYLASKLPPSPDAQSGSLTPQLAKVSASAPERAKFLRAVDAVQGGPAEIMKRFAAGKATPEDLEVLQKLYPHSYAEVRTKVATKCAERKSPLSYQQQLRFGDLFNMPTTPTLTNGFRMAIQQSYVTHAQAADGGKSAPRRSAPASLGISKSLESPFERARGG